MLRCVVVFVDELAAREGGGDTTINWCGGATMVVLRAVEIVMVMSSAMLIVGGIGCGTVLAVPTTTLGHSAAEEDTITGGDCACWRWIDATTLVQRAGLVGVGGWAC